jgi:alpha-beta hydrolase superfamily lysophospholipase
MSTDSDEGPARASELSWQLDGISIAATLVRPDVAGPVAGAVLIAGSGPTDRDWNSPLLPGSRGSARLIADTLARAGVASLRYDKRASGPHARENAVALLGKLSMQSHLDELAGAVRMLAQQPDIRTDRIFAIANSEGTLHALNYQLGEPRIPFAGLVLIGPPGRSVGLVAHAQLAEQAAHVADGEDLLRRYDAGVADFLAGKPVVPDPLLPKGVQDLLLSLSAPANQPFARELWAADAASLLPRISAPTLVIIGKKDIQVDWRADGEPLQHAAAGHGNVTFVFPEEANHVLKHEPRPRAELVTGDVLANYNGPEAELDPEAMTTIVDWLLRFSPQG